MVNFGLQKEDGKVLKSVAYSPADLASIVKDNLWCLF